MVIEMPQIVLLKPAINHVWHLLLVGVTQEMCQRRRVTYVLHKITAIILERQIYQEDNKKRPMPRMQG